MAAEHEVVTGRERARGAGSGEDESSGVSELEKAFQVQAQGYLCTDISGIPLQRQLKHVRTWLGSSVKPNFPEKGALSSAQQGPLTQGVLTSALPHPVSQFSVNSTVADTVP